MMSKNILELNEANFKFCLKQNENILSTQLETGDICPNQFWMINKDGTSLIGPGNHPMRQTRKSDDIIAATIVKAIAISADNGVDAIRWQDETKTKAAGFIDIECKLSYRSKNGILVTDNGTLYTGNPWGTKNNRTSLRGGISANYEIVNNLSKKNMETHFVLMDDDTREIVCAYCLNGAQVVNLLSINPVSGAAKTGKKRSIKLSTFQDNGDLTETNFEITGYWSWTKQITEMATTYQNGFWVV